MAPVGKLCMMESLHNGVLDLEDFAVMNDTLAMRADNEEIARELSKRGR